MSFDLFVFVPFLPSDLTKQWEQSLPEFGLRCTFYPKYHPSTWRDCFAPVRVEVLPGSFPFADAYGSAPLLTEISLDDMDVVRGEYTDIKTSALEDVPLRLHSALERATRCIHFHTAAGRIPLALRMQCFTAATLAVMTQSVLLDPQEGGYLAAQDAIEHARQVADDYERYSSPDDWDLTHFTAWSQWDGEIPIE